MANSGFVETGLSTPLELKWKIRTAAAVTGGLIGNEQFLVAGDLGGNLYLVNSRDGRKLSKRTFRGAFTAPLVLVDSILFFATNINGEKFGALNLRNGTTLWQKPGHDIWSPFAVDDGMLFVGDGDGNVSAWRTTDGSRAWAVDMGSAISGGCVIAESLIIAASVGGDVHALDISTGKRIWARNLRTAVMGQMAVKDSFLFCAGLDSMVHALDIRDGSILWEFKSGGGIRGGISFAGDSLYFGSNDGCLYALNMKTGNLLFVFETSYPIIGAPLITRNEIAVGSLSGYLYVLARFTGQELFEYNAHSPIITPPILIGNQVIFCCRNREMIALRSHNEF